MNCHELLWEFVLVSLLQFVSSQLQVISTETNQPFANPDRITVGSASDLVVQVRCTSQLQGASSTGLQWNYMGNGSAIDVGLRPFGTSQEDGVLRIYPANILTDGAMFQCSDGNMMLNVTFDLQVDLFFLNPIPPTVSAFANRLELCQVPDIPAADVSIVNDTNSVTGRNYFYCRVETRRGTFRSRSVISLPVPRFRYEPKNIVAQPVNGSASAAFSCAVSPIADLVQIQWQYVMMSFGSRMGVRTGPIPGILSNDSGSGVSIIQLADPGTSILVLDSVGNGHEGLYSCVAVFSDGRIITSSQASLTYHGTSLGVNDVIILGPPTTISVTEGDAVSLPCVGSRGTAPIFTLSGVAQTSGQYSLDFASITASAAGIYTCQVGATAATVTVYVAPMISRPSMTDITVLRGPAYSQEIAISEASTDFPFLRCLRSPASQWLRNGALRTSSPNLVISPIVEGIYQCVGVVTGQPETDFTGESASDFYLLVQAINTPTIDITPNMEIFILGQEEVATLNCSATGNPLPLLEWSRDGTQVNQAATGFMETAFSTLTVNITELNVGTHNFQCTATVDTPATQSESSATMATVTIYSPPIFTADPQNVTVVVGDIISLNCSAQATPLPDITWMVNSVMVVDDNVYNISFFDTGDVRTSTLMVVAGMAMVGSNNTFLCEATNTVREEISEMATVTVYSPPMFTVDPQNMIVVVGDFISLNCSAQATPPPNITWIYSNGTAIMDDDIFNISPSSMDDVTTSTLSFIGGENMAGISIFLCVATNVVRDQQSDTAIVTIQSLPVLLVNPESTIAIVSDHISLNCFVKATPTVPTISWVDGDGVEITNSDTFNIEASDVSVSTSVLSFTATAENRTGNGSMFQCVATVQVEPINRTLTNESDIATLTIADVPGSLAPVEVSDITSHTAVVSWQEPFSLIEITNYTVTVYEIASGNVQSFTVTTLAVTVSEEVLRPDRRYVVSVVAYNRAGRGEETDTAFNTMEDAPDGAPNITSSSSIRLQEIVLSWSEVDPDLQNGNIANYTIRFRILVGNGNPVPKKTVNALTVTLTAADGIEAGITYSISVAASTRVGLGPFSSEVTQATIPQPSAQTTIPITLPSIPGASRDRLSHLWVIAMKVNGISLNENPTMRFPDNSSFTTYSNDIPFNTPYIVAEIDASRITLPARFLLGDETATGSLNDNPKRYQNGPLTQGTQYTVFVWGFPPSVANTSTRRQYNVFFSSAFSPVATTATSPMPQSSSGIIFTQTAEPGTLYGVPEKQTNTAAVVVGGIIGGAIGVVIGVVIAAAVTIVIVKYHHKKQRRKGRSKTRDLQESVSVFYDGHAAQLYQHPEALGISCSSTDDGDIHEYDYVDPRVQGDEEPLVKLTQCPAYHSLSRKNT